LIKNFIFSTEPAEYGFAVTEKLDQSLQLVDITDDITGKPHKLATVEIPMYVNEVGHNADLAQNVFIREEGDRIVKYFFQSDKPLKKGDFVELLTNYRDAYEGARERKGYGWRNISEGLEGDNCLSARMERNFHERSDVQNIIGPEISLQKISCYLQFILSRIWNPLMNHVREQGEDSIAKISVLQWIAILRVEWLTYIFRQRIEKDRAEPTKDNLLNQILIFNMTRTLDSMKADEVDISELATVNTVDIDGRPIAPAIISELVEEVCFRIHDRMPLLLDSSAYCSIGRQVVEKLCLVVAIAFRTRDSVSDEVKRETCDVFFRIAIDAAQQIELSATNFSTEAGNSGLLFSSGIGVKSYLCCSTRTASELVATSNCFNLDNTTISKGFRATIVEKVECYHSIPNSGLEQTLDSGEDKIAIEDWFCMEKRSESSLDEEFSDLSSIPRSLPKALAMPTTINTSWYVVWQVLWPVHMLATEFLGESIYSLDALANALNIPDKIARYAITRGMNIEGVDYEQLRESVLKYCRPVIPCTQQRVCQVQPSYLSPSRSNAPRIIIEKSSKAKNKRKSPLTDTVRIPPKLVYEGPVKCFVPGVEIPIGWTQRSFERRSGASAGHVDHYWFTPQRHFKLRSYTEISRFLTLLDTSNGNEDAAYTALKFK
jgi:hypothetical protein